MTSRAWSLLLVLSVLWGGSFFFYKVLVTALPPVTIALGRVVLAAIPLNLLLLARGDKLPKDWGSWLGFIAMGMLNNVLPFALIAYGETKVSSGLASILNATTPIFTILAAHAFTADEKLTRAKAIGVAFGFAGVAILIGPHALRHQDGSLIGIGACLAAALAYAVAGIYGRRFRATPPLTMATGQITASVFILLPASLLIDRPWHLPMPSMTAWAALVGIALLSTAIAYVIYFRLLAMVGATNLLLVTFLLPISAMALGAGLLGEPITWPAIVGMVVIGLGFAAIDGRPWAKLTRGRRAAPAA